MKALFTIVLAFFLTNTFSQLPTFEWAKCYGGANTDICTSISATSDGFIMTGITFSNDQQVWGNHGSFDAWVVKINMNGDTLWTRCIGGTDSDNANCIKQTSDGGYILVGETNSIDIHATGNNGEEDFWVVKLNSLGDVVWHKCYGGTEEDIAYDVIQTSDGGYAVIGESTSSDCDVWDNNGKYDYWVLKLDYLGDTLWTRSYGGAEHDRGQCIIQTSDGGYVIGGKAISNNQDVPENNGSYDQWIVKLNSEGDIEWSNVVGGSDWEITHAIKKIPGGYIVSGATCSVNGDIHNNNGLLYTYDYMLTKYDDFGDTLWTKCHGGTSSDLGYNVHQTGMGGFIQCGYAKSTDGDVSGNHGEDDFWIMQTDSLGEIIWSHCYGGNQMDRAFCSELTDDGFYVLAGYTQSSNGDIIGNHGGTDFWVVKLKKVDVQVNELKANIENKIFPNPTNGKIELIAEDIYSVELIDVRGNLVLKKESKTNILGLDISPLTNGPYILNLMDKNNLIISSHKIIKE